MELIMKLTDFLEDIGRPVAYYPSLVKVTGSVGAAILLCQLIYWRGREADPEGWIYKTQAEISEETGLTRFEQEGARKLLKEKGILREKFSGVPRKLYFSISLERVNEEWLKAKENSLKNHHNACESPRGEEISLKNQHNAENPHYIMRKNHIIECGNSACNNAENQQTITEITTENIFNKLNMSDAHKDSSPDNGSPFKDSTGLPLFGVKGAIKERKKEKQVKNENSPSKELLLFFAEQYEKVFKVPYNINWGKEMKLMGLLLKRYEAEKIKKAMRWYFRIKDDFYFSNGYSFGIFYQKFNAILLMGRNTLDELSERIIKRQLGGEQCSQGLL